MASSVATTTLRTVYRSAPLVSSRAFVRPAASVLNQQRSSFTTTLSRMALAKSEAGHDIAVLNQELVPRLPSHAPMLFAQKKAKGLSFEKIAQAIGRDEIAAAALFYGQTKATEEDIKALSKLLDIPESTLLATEITGWPDRGRSLEMPPREPLIYRFYEIVQNYGYALKGVLNEKFGDGIMSAIAFSMHVERELDDKGVEWVNIKMRGKWLPFTRF